MLSSSSYTFEWTSSRWPSFVSTASFWKWFSANSMYFLVLRTHTEPVLSVIATTISFLCSSLLKKLLILLVILFTSHVSRFFVSLIRPKRCFSVSYRKAFTCLPAGRFWRWADIPGQPAQGGLDHRSLFVVRFVSTVNYANRLTSNSHETFGWLLPQILAPTNYCVK